MTDVAIAGLPAATSVLDTDLIIVEEVGSPNVTKRGTAAQMRANSLPLAGGTLTGELIINAGGIAVTGASQFNNTVTLNAGGGWSSNNVGKQLLVTTPTGVSNPGIGITDTNGANLWGVWNNAGALKLSVMPAYSDGATGPTNIASLSSTGIAVTGTLSSSGALTVTSGGATVTAGGLTVSAGGLTVGAGGAAITGNSTITGTLGGLTGLTVASGGATITAGGLHVTAGGATVTAGGLTVSAGGAAITGSTTVTGAFGVSAAQTTLTGSGTTGATTGLAVQNFSGTLGFVCSDNGGVTIPRLASFATASAANMNWDGATGLVQLSTSSARYKRDITTFPEALAAARTLRPVRFRSRAENDGDTVFAGLIAEEVDDAGLTEFVSYDQEGRPNAIHYGPLAALALGAVSELADAFDALSARLAALEAKT